MLITFMKTLSKAVHKCWWICDYTVTDPYTKAILLQLKAKLIFFDHF